MEEENQLDKEQVMDTGEAQADIKPEADPEPNQTGMCGDISGQIDTIIHHSSN